MDEMGEIMKLEMDGIVLMGKFSVLFARQLMALFKWSQKKIIENPRSNEVSIKRIYQMCASQGKGQPVVMQLPKEYLEEILAQAEEKGLHYATMIDLDVTDGCIPILITPEESIVWKQINDIYLSKVENAQSEAVDDTQALIDAAKAEAAQYPADSKERLAAMQKIEDLETLQKEQQEVLDYTKGMHETNGETTLAQYFASAKNTDFARDPEMAVAEFEKGVPLSKHFDAAGAFSRVYDTKNFPGDIVYISAAGCDTAFQRTFLKDENGIGYSEFSFKNKNGDIIRLNQSMNAEQAKEAGCFGKDQLNEYLKACGVSPSAVFRVDVGTEAYQTYKKYHNNVEIEKTPENLSPHQRRILESENREAARNGDTFVVDIATVLKHETAASKDVPFLIADRDEEGMLELSIVIPNGPNAGEVKLDGTQYTEQEIRGKMRKTKDFSDDGHVNLHINKNDSFILATNNGKNIKLTADELRVMAQGKTQSQGQTKGKSR